MGGDGGSIPGRQDLVKTKRKPEKVLKFITLKLHLSRTLQLGLAYVA